MVGFLPNSDSTLIPAAPKSLLPPDSEPQAAREDPSATTATTLSNLRTNKAPQNIPARTPRLLDGHERAHPSGHDQATDRPPASPFDHVQHTPRCLQPRPA